MQSVNAVTGARQPQMGNTNTLQLLRKEMLNGGLPFPGLGAGQSVGPKTTPSSFPAHNQPASKLPKKGMKFFKTLALVGGALLAFKLLMSKLKPSGAEEAAQKTVQQATQQATQQEGGTGASAVGSSLDVSA